MECECTNLRSGKRFLYTVVGKGGGGGVVFVHCGWEGGGGSFYLRFKNEFPAL